MHTVNEELFGTPEQSVKTLRSMACLDPDTFDDCFDCLFWIYGKSTDGCPPTPDGCPSVGGRSLEELLCSECKEGGR